MHFIRLILGLSTLGIIAVVLYVAMYLLSPLPIMEAATWLLSGSLVLIVAYGVGRLVADWLAANPDGY